MPGLVARFHVRGGYRAAPEPIMECEIRPRQESLATLLPKLQRIPVRPQAHQEVLEALGNPDLSMNQIAERINKDVGLTAHVLKMANSAAFSTAEKVSSTLAAVTLMGTMHLRALVNTAWVFQMLEGMSALKGFDPKSECEHALEVGQETLRLAEAVRLDQEITELAYTAGLLHDIGKVLLAVNTPELFTSISLKAEERARPRWLIEREMLGCDHGNIGGAVLQGWGLNPVLVNAVRWHHEPERQTHDSISPLMLVHLADCTVRHTEPDIKCKRRFAYLSKTPEHA